MTSEQQSRFARVLAALSALYPEWEIDDEEFLAAAEAHLARRQAQSKQSQPASHPA